MGMAFFAGLFNSMYYSKMKSYVHTTAEALDLKLKLLKTEAEEEDGEKDNPELCEKLARLYRSFYLWLDEAKILDSTLYIPAPLTGPRPGQAAAAARRGRRALAGVRRHGQGGRSQHGGHQGVGQTAL